MTGRREIEIVIGREIVREIETVIGREIAIVDEIETGIVSETGRGDERDRERGTKTEKVEREAAVGIGIVGGGLEAGAFHWRFTDSCITFLLSKHMHVHIIWGYCFHRTMLSFPNSCIVLMKHDLVISLVS